MKRIGLALGSGGAKGLSHIAFIKVLDELGIKPAIIAGTSIGAIVGAFYAAGVSGVHMEYILGQVRLRDINKMVDFSLLSKSALLKGRGVEDFMYRNIPARRFEDLRIPLKVVATDFWRRKEVILDSGQLVPAIRASMSMPVIFEPVRLGNRVLVDGSAVNPLPHDIIRKDCDIVIAIDVSGEKVPLRQELMPSMYESIMSMFQIMQASIVASKKHVSKPDIYVKPTLANIRVLDFDRYDDIMREAEKDAERFREELLLKIKRKKLFPFLKRALVPFS